MAAEGHVRESPGYTVRHHLKEEMREKVLVRKEKSTLGHVTAVSITRPKEK